MEASVRSVKEATSVHVCAVCSDGADCVSSSSSFSLQQYNPNFAVSAADVVHSVTALLEDNTRTTASQSQSNTNTSNTTAVESEGGEGETGRVWETCFWAAYDAVKLLVCCLCCCLPAAAAAQQGCCCCCCCW